MFDKYARTLCLSLHLIFYIYFSEAVLVIVIDVLLLHQAFFCEFDKWRNSWSKVPWISFFLGVKSVKHISKNSVSRFISSHFKLQWNSTFTFIFCCQLAWSPRRQPIKRLLNWNYPISKNSLFNSQVFPSLSLSLCLPVCVCLLLLCLFLLLLMSFWHFTSLSSCLYHLLFPLWSLCLTWEEGLLMNVRVKWKDWVIFRTTAFLLLKVLWK